MRIGIDGRELQGRPTGVGRYVAEIVGRWSRVADAHEFFVYAPRAMGKVSDVVGGWKGVTLRVTDGGAGTVWEQWSLPRALRADGVDVLFAPAYSAPLGCPCPVGLTMHDVSFCAHPEWYSWREGLRRRTLARQCCRRAGVIFTVSEFSASEIVKHLGVPRHRIAVETNGIEHVPRVPAPQTQWLSRPATPHILSVGSIFNRRHIPTLVQAFARSFRHDAAARLSIVGENRTYPHVDLKALAHAEGVGDRTTLFDYADDSTLEALFATADLVVFVSEYEGFGLPVIEALARGIPVVAADTPVSHEVCGAAAAFVRPGDTTALASALADVVVNRARLAEQLRTAGAVLDRYRWDTTASRILARLVSLGACT